MKKCFFNENEFAMLFTTMQLLVIIWSEFLTPFKLCDLDFYVIFFFSTTCRVLEK